MPLSFPTRIKPRMETIVRPFAEVLVLAKEGSALAATPALAENAIRWGAAADFGELPETALITQPTEIKVQAPPASGTPARDIEQVFDNFLGTFTGGDDDFALPEVMYFGSAPDITRDFERQKRTPTGFTLRRAPPTDWYFFERHDA
jgi:hypothetical protein